MDFICSSLSLVSIVLFLVKNHKKMLIFFVNNLPK